MKRTISALVILVILWAGAATAQLETPSVSSPVTLDLGVGGGMSLPTGTLNNTNNSGWHIGGLARLGGWIPVTLVASGSYHHLPNAGGTDAMTITMVAGGLEMPLNTVAVRPYIGVDGLMNFISSTAANSPSRTRYGLGMGIGVDFKVPGAGGFDTSIKYQLLNAWNKDNSDNDTVAQIAANLTYMFGL